ncbi:MAG: metallophosphoesterase [Clostridia bacterium]|nr:metallophosphoesterase [Clostridia bacterium]
MALKIICVILGAIILFGIVSAIANKVYIKNTLEYISTLGSVVSEDRIVVGQDSSEYYTITIDRDLKIVQITDIHIGGSWTSKKKDRQAINSVASMIIEEKPDIVFATGDISYPVPYVAATFNNQYASTIFANLMEQLGVYWIPTFGNHDSESYSIYDREAMGDFYSRKEWKNCLFQKGDENIDGYGNSVIKVKNSDGIITQALFTIDSNDYPEDSFLGLTGGYDNIHQNQIDWYKATCEKLNKENQAFIQNNFDEEKDSLLEKFGLVKSLVFLHIPPVEYAEAWNEFKENGYKDSENVKYYYGTLGEDVCHPKIDDRFFETVLECNSTQGIFCGHDHINTFSLEYKGVRLTYGKSIDFVAYLGISKLGTQRGCTVITVKPDGTFDCYQESYYQDKYVSPDKEEVTMQKLNEEFN